MSELKEKDQRGKALASLIVGIFGMIGWIIPIIGLPVNIVALVLAIQSKRSSRRRMAIAGMVLSIIGLILTIVNGALGAYLLSTGQLFG